MKNNYIIYLIVAILVIVLCVVIYISFTKRNNMIDKTNGKQDITYKTISFEEMERLISTSKVSNYVILDVRTEEEYKQGRIKNSILIPDYEIENILNKVPDKNTYIFVYCRSGNRSKKATLKLNNMGYKNVYDAGGIISYKGEIVT